MYLYGSQGPLYGEFDVSIDGVVVHNGYSGQDELLFQQLLYSNATLPMGLHNVTITNSWTNAARNLTDIDYVSNAHTLSNLTLLISSFLVRLDK